jgi:hypothetical protein
MGLRGAACTPISANAVWTSFGVDYLGIIGSINTRAFVVTYLGKLAIRGLLDRVADGRNIVRAEVNCQYPDRRLRVNHHGISAN